MVTRIFIILLKTCWCTSLRLLPTRTLWVMARGLPGLGIKWLHWVRKVVAKLKFYANEILKTILFVSNCSPGSNWCHIHQKVILNINV